MWAERQTNEQKRKIRKGFALLYWNDGEGDKVVSRGPRTLAITKCIAEPLVQDRKSLGNDSEEPKQSIAGSSAAQVLQKIWMAMRRWVAILSIISQSVRILSIAIFERCHCRHCYLLLRATTASVDTMLWPRAHESKNMFILMHILVHTHAPIQNTHTETGHTRTQNIHTCPPTHTPSDLHTHNDPCRIQNGNMLETSRR